MRKLMLSALVVAALTFAAVALAAGGNGNGNTTQFGPFASTSTDNGSCSQPWAEDTFDRVFKVRDNGDGTFNVREEFKHGSFVTTGPVSPGACDNTNTPHGSTLRPGVTGTMEGYLEGSVSGGAFNPNGCSVVGADCTSTAGFIAAVFGPTAVFSCSVGYADCSFNFNYAAGDQGLRYHHWQDSSGNGPNQPPETFRGDIADS